MLLQLNYLKTTFVRILMDLDVRMEGLSIQIVESQWTTGHDRGLASHLYDQVLLDSALWCSIEQASHYDQSIGSL